VRSPHRPFYGPLACHRTMRSHKVHRQGRLCTSAAAFDEKPSRGTSWQISNSSGKVQACHDASQNAKKNSAPRAAKLRHIARGSWPARTAVRFQKATIAAVLPDGTGRAAEICVEQPDGIGDRSSKPGESRKVRSESIICINCPNATRITS